MLSSIDESGVSKKIRLGISHPLHLIFQRDIHARFIVKTVCFLPEKPCKMSDEKGLTLFDALNREVAEHHKIF